MRTLVVFGLTFAVSAALGLAFLPSPAATTAGPPIPQDHARQERRRRDRLEWNRRTLGGAYDQVGRRDPRWDEPARRALELAARMYAQDFDPAVTYDDIRGPAKAAIDAGCDDPLVSYLHVQSLVVPGGPVPGEVVLRARKMARGFVSSPYPALRRVVAFKAAGQYLVAAGRAGAEARREAVGDFDAALGLIGEAFARDERNEFWEDRMRDNLVGLIANYRKLGVAPAEAYRRVDARLAEVAEAKVLRLLVRGEFWNQFGWDARTNSVAAEVPEGGFEVFGKRLRIAREAVEEAWRLRPGVRRAACLMIDIEKSIGGDRAVMELWFDRAMKIDGDDLGPCLAKLDWLDPKWHGSSEAMIAFGRACRDTKNWRGGITLLVAEAHLRHSRTLPGSGQVDYLKTPEVWADIRPVFDEYLEHRPDDRVARSKFAAIGFLAGHLPEAQAQFEILGDRLTSWPDFPSIPLEELEQMRVETARSLAGSRRE